MMKLPFKHIALLVLLSLVGTFAYQGYWLVNLYHTQKQEYARNVFDAMRISDYNEMMFRVAAMQQNSGIEHGSITASAGYADDGSTLMGSTVVTEREDSTGKKRADTLYTRVDTVPQEDKALALLQSSDNVEMVLTKHSNMDSLTLYFQSGIHSGLDLYQEPNIHIYDSLLTLTLAEYGIRMPHQTEIINRKTRNIVSCIRSDSTYRPSTQAVHCDYLFNYQEKTAYRLWFEPTDGVILRQMGGILVTSFIILLVLGFSFGYLIRTILRQKSLEEMKSDFTNNITHELKTPIAVAYAANDALLNFNQAEEKVKRNQYLTICQEQLQHLSGLVEQILNMSLEQRKSFRLHPEKLLLKELIDALIEQHQLKVESSKTLSITCEILPENLSIMADRNHFSNILSNLIDNAVKYSPDEVYIAIHCQRRDNRIEINITDRGLGIAPEKQRHLFDKFYRIPTGNRHNVKGYGLGLYYVRTMIEKHGGTISVTSAPGQGSRFTIRL